MLSLYMQTPNHLSTAEAAERLGLSASTVRRRIKTGELPAVERHGSLLIPIEAVEAELHGISLPRLPVDQAPDFNALPRVISVEVAAEMLQTTRDNIWYHCRAGNIPCTRIGRRVLIPTRSFLQLLDGPAGELSDQAA